eukprot:3145811-Heterocapsa_arctica.AAC.1
MREGLNDPRGKIIYHILEICRAIRPPFLHRHRWVWESGIPLPREAGTGSEIPPAVPLQGNYDRLQR